MFCDCCFTQPDLTLDEFWVMFDEKYSHLSELKSILLEIQKQEESGIHISSIPYNFVIQGKAGTGKSEVATDVIPNFLFALGILKSRSTVQNFLDDMCKKGQKTLSLSNKLINERFQVALSKTLIIDDVSDFKEDSDWYVV